jgi:hypothetical protein
MNKKTLIAYLGLFFSLSSWAVVRPAMPQLTPEVSLAERASQQLLPENFTIYTDGIVTINHPVMGLTAKLLPTVNLYKGTPGCYIACYSHQQENSAYGVGNNIYVHGQVRIAGRYTGRICEPTNFAGKDISSEEAFKTICSGQIKTCTDRQCWAGGDTGGWFGIQ